MHKICTYQQQIALATQQQNTNFRLQHLRSSPSSSWRHCRGDGAATRAQVADTFADWCVLVGVGEKRSSTGNEAGRKHEPTDTRLLIIWVKIRSLTSFILRRSRALRMTNWSVSPETIESQHDWSLWEESVSHLLTSDEADACAHERVGAMQCNAGMRRDAAERHSNLVVTSYHVWHVRPALWCVQSD